MTGRTFSRIHVVGGGSNAGYLNELTARATGKEVHAGPGEATAIGNITAQMLKQKSLNQSKRLVQPFMSPLELRYIRLNEKLKQPGYTIICIMAFVVMSCGIWANRLFLNL